MTKKQIGSIIKSRRSQQKISAYYVAKVAKVMPHQLASIENADKSYTIDSLLAVAQCLELDISLKNK